MASPTQSNGSATPPMVPAIPLTPDLVPRAADQSIGDLVRDVTTQVSALVRSEVELARAEVTAEVKKGLQGSVFFILALAIVVFSLFFLFITLAQVIAIWLPRWAAFGIVFLLMLLAAGLCGLLGYLRVRRIHKPERTIESAQEAAKALSPSGRAELSAHGADVTGR